MRGIAYGILLALTVTAAGAADDVTSANYMLPYCKSFAERHYTQGVFEQGHCSGLVGSLIYLGQHADVSASAFSGEGQLRAIKERWRCLDVPTGVTRGQAVQVVVKYIEERPKRLHENFRALALEALFDAWACRD